MARERTTLRAAVAAAASGVGEGARISGGERGGSGRTIVGPPARTGGGPRRAATGRATARATAKQGRMMRRQRGRHVIGVSRVVNAPAFADGGRALRYALARRVPVPWDVAEASRFISMLKADPRSGIVGWANGDAPRIRRFRRRFQGLLRERYGWPDPSWVDRLNAAVEERWASLDPGLRGLLATDAARYRAEVIDPLFRERRAKATAGAAPAGGGAAPAGRIRTGAESGTESGAESGKPGRRRGTRGAA